MTICIAAICGDNTSIVLASDNMVTNSMLSIEFEHPEKKMAILSNNCIALTAGDALAYTELFNIVQSKISGLNNPQTSQIVEVIKESYRTIREREVLETILYPMGFNTFKDFYLAQRTIMPDIIIDTQTRITKYDYELEILVAGISNNKPEIYGIYNPGTSKNFNAIGFNAIGSGYPHAINTLIARNCHQKSSLNEVLLIVYEAKKMAEKAPGVGSNMTDMRIVDSEGNFGLSEEDLKSLSIIYDKWIDKDPEWEKDIESLIQKIRER